jgi:hypothetical protein
MATSSIIPGWREGGQGVEGAGGLAERAEVGPHVLPAVEETADGEQHPGDTGRGCAVVDQQEPAVRCEHPPHLSEGGQVHRVRKVVEDQRADD